MMLIKLFLFFLLLLILPDMYIYKAYIRRVSQKWTHWAYWLPSLFLLLGMTLVFSIHEPRPDSMQRLSNFYSRTDKRKRRSVFRFRQP